MERHDEQLVLPCPFCGGKPKTGVCLNDGSGLERGYVGCLNSNCNVSPSVRSLMPVGEAEKAAIRRWNVRVK